MSNLSTSYTPRKYNISQCFSRGIPLFVMVLVSPLIFFFLNSGNFALELQKGIDVQALVFFLFCSRIESRDTFCYPVLGNYPSACDAGSHSQQKRLWGLFQSLRPDRSGNGYMVTCF